MNLKKKNILVNKRKKRIQYKLKKYNGNQYPRIIFRSSLRHLHCQLVDENQNKTLFTISTDSNSFDQKMKSNTKTYTNKEFARKLAILFVEKLKDFQVGSKFIFDKGSKSYQGKVKVFADELRSHNLTF